MSDESLLIRILKWPLRTILWWLNDRAALIAENERQLDYIAKIEAEIAHLDGRNRVLEEVCRAAKENIALQSRLATVEEINAAEKKLEDAVKQAGEL